MKIKPKHNKPTLQKPSSQFGEKLIVIGNAGGGRSGIEIFKAGDSACSMA